MDDRLKKRIYMFYAAGVVNLIIGLYVLIFARGIVPDDKFWLIVGFFLGFAAIDFVMPYLMKQKWVQDQARLAEERKAQSRK
jgi:cadmium resistance protein CadD (predicted permease)